MLAINATIFILDFTVLIHLRNTESLYLHSDELSSDDFIMKLEKVFVKHYAPNHMPDPKGEWSVKENNSELHYGICSKVNQFIYTLVCNCMQNIRILA